MNTGRIDSDARLLVVMRHGEAEPHSPGGDEQRELTERGQQDARDAAAWLVAQGVDPDLAIVSSATRTRQTWEALQAGGLESDDVEVDEAVYNGTLEDLTEAVRTASDDVRCLVLVAHAPGVEELATCAEVHCETPDVWEPATVGVLSHPGDWSEFPSEETALVLCRPGGSDGLDAENDEN